MKTRANDPCQRADRFLAAARDGRRMRRADAARGMTDLNDAALDAPSKDRVRLYGWACFDLGVAMRRQPLGDVWWHPEPPADLVAAFTEAVGPLVRIWLEPAEKKWLEDALEDALSRPIDQDEAVVLAAVLERLRAAAPEVTP